MPPDSGCWIPLAFMEFMPAVGPTRGSVTQVRWGGQQDDAAAHARFGRKRGGHATTRLPACLNACLRTQGVELPLQLEHVVDVAGPCGLVS